MIKTCSQMYRSANKYSQYSSSIWPVWVNGWVFVYELSGFTFESCCSHLNFRHRAFCKQGDSLHSWNYRVYINAYVTWKEHTVKCTVMLFWYLFFFFFLTAWKMEIDNINPCRIFRSKKSAGAKILTEWKTALTLIQMIC